VTAKPLVSAIVATYNRADVVGQAIESILGQTYENIEVIIVDDGSTDSTHEVLRQFGNRLRVFRQENAGPAAARNRGIAAARGEIISFLDSDDTWLQEKTERQVALLERAGNSVPCCVCDADLKSTNRPTLGSFQNSLLTTSEKEGLWLNAPQVLMNRFMLFNQTVAVRRWALDKIGGFDERLRYMEDYDLALRLSLLGPFAFINEPLVNYNLGSTGSLADEALQKTVCLKEHVVRIRERANETVMASSNYAKLRTPARRALRKARRELWVARLRKRRLPGALTMSHFLERAEHYCGAIADRSPWFERMEAVQIPERTESRSNSCSELGFQGMAR
jgi:glycosyltransferase involved in cell wall biosynthesis